jgi:ribosomal protein S18 acetylase RimI-like enzyme
LPYLRFGPIAGIVAVLKRLLRPWLEWGSVVVFELPIVAVDGPSVDLEVRAIGVTDVPRVAQVFGRSHAVLAERLALGDRGYVGFLDGRPVHMRWVATRATLMPETGLWLHPRPGTVYIYDLETSQDARGRRLTQAVRAAMDGALAAEGFHAKLAYVRADNHPMWRTLRDAPGPPRRLGRIFYVRRPGHPPTVLGRAHLPAATL